MLPVFLPPYFGLQNWRPGMEMSKIGGYKTVKTHLPPISTKPAKVLYRCAESDNEIDPNEFMYPSTQTERAKKYSWSALCRRVAEGDNSVQVTLMPEGGPGGRGY